MPALAEIVDSEIGEAGGIADADAVDAERDQLPVERDGVVVDIERRDFAADRDRPAGREVVVPPSLPSCRSSASGCLR